MERLTKRGNGHAYYPRCFKEPCYGSGCKIKDCPFETAVCERLAAYEDTGLEPEAIETVKLALAAKHLVDLETLNNTPISRLVELAEADKDGRAIVLPAKPGEHIFVTGKRKIVECVVDAIYIDQRGPEAVMTFQCDSDCDGCPFYSPLPDPEGDFRCEGELGEAEIGFERFPAIAFPTREEAEKALEVMKDG